MSTYTQILYHLVFGTKSHEATLDLQQHEQLFIYMAGLLRNKHCMPYRLGGYTEHVHILFSLHPSCRLSDIVKDIKLAASKMIKSEKLFPFF
jgi:putative transposase